MTKRWRFAARKRASDAEFMSRLNMGAAGAAEAETALLLR
jgi:hypothetical protein